MPVPTMDFETYSEAGFVWQSPTEKYPLGRWIAPEGAKEPGIAAVGGPAYSQHPSTEVLTLSYDLCDGRGIRRWRPGQPLPFDLFDHVLNGGVIEAHNAMFERLIVENVCVPKYGWPIFPATAWRCSMAAALVAQRPAALGALAQVLELVEQKDKEGTRLIKKFSIPQQPIPGLIDKKTGRVKRADQPARRIFPHEDPEDFEKLCAYCDQDVRTEMAAMERLPPLEPHEVQAWQMTQSMNHRGLGVDRTGLESCLSILAQVIDRYGAECEQITGFKVTQLEKLKGWLGAYGVHTASLDAEALTGLLKRDDLHPLARRVLELRERTGSASVKKMFAIRNRLSHDDRLRDILIHHGTRPGRPTGEGPQPLNLPKAGPKLSWCDCGRPARHAPICPWCGNMKRADAKCSWTSAMVDHVLEIMQIGSLDMVEAYFGDAMTALQGCVRGLFTAGPGNQLVSTDYSSLQAVVAACLAGEQWRIDAFKNNEPIYLLGASKITGTPVDEYLEYARRTGDHHPDRQKIGKVSELACGFQGWINSYRAFGSEEPDEVIRQQILAWRAASPMIVEAWGGQWRGPPWRRERQELYGLEGMFIAAVQRPGEYFEYRGIGFCMEEKDTLVIRLPQIDGIRRALRYHEPMLTPSARNPDELSISYMTYNTNPNYGARGWVRMPTWGGRLFENCLAEGTEVLTDQGWVCIEEIRLEHRIHDGIELVNHGGSVYKSVQDCISIDEVWMTPDHEVLDDAENWRTASSVQRLFRPKIWDASGVMPDAKEARTASHPLDVSLRLREGMRESGSGCFEIHEERRNPQLRMRGVAFYRSEEHPPRHERPTNLRRLSLDARPLSPSEPSIVAQLRRAWDNGLRGMGRFIRNLFSRYGAVLSSGVGIGPKGQQRSVFARELSLGNERTQFEQPTQYSIDPNPRGFEADGRRREKRRNSTSPSALSSGPWLDGSRGTSAGRVQARKVYDILNCGPRRRFVVRGKNGPFIVHNCVMGVEVDIQRFGAKLMEAHGYPLVLSVYDENVAEIPLDKPLTLGLPSVEGLNPYVQEIEHLLAIMPPEISWWPIKAADGWAGKRYRKA